MAAAATMAMLDELIRYMRGHDDVWFSTHAELAQYYLDNG